MIDLFPEGPYWVIDFLPEQVPENGPGQFFAVEKYFLQPARLGELRRRFAEILLKLSCYYEIRVCSPEGEQEEIDPDPEALSARIHAAEEDLLITFPAEGSLITLNRDDLYMTVYRPSEALLERVKALALSEGLFLRGPKQ